MSALAHKPMCAHCELAAATVQAVRAENERLREEVARLRPRRVKWEGRRARPRSGEEFVDDLKDRGLAVYVRAGMGAKCWMAQCPAHEDRNGSLSITELNNGRILLNCFTGCETDRVLEAIGWTFDQLRGEGD